MEKHDNKVFGTVPSHIADQITTLLEDSKANDAMLRVALQEFREKEKSLNAISDELWDALYTHFPEMSRNNPHWVARDTDGHMTVVEGMPPVDEVYKSQDEPRFERNPNTAFHPDNTTHRQQGKKELHDSLPNFEAAAAVASCSDVDILTGVPTPEPPTELKDQVPSSEEILKKVISFAEKMGMKPPSHKNKDGDDPPPTAPSAA